MCVCDAGEAGECRELQVTHRELQWHTTKLMSTFGVIVCRLHREPGKIINAVDLEEVIENSVFRTEEQFVRE